MGRLQILSRPVTLELTWLAPGYLRANLHTDIVRIRDRKGQYFENMTYLPLKTDSNPLDTFMGERQSIPSLGTIPRARDAPPCIFGGSGPINAVDLSAKLSVNISLYVLDLKSHQLVAAL